jgi:hypothetical protein
MMKMTTFNVILHPDSIVLKWALARRVRRSCVVSFVGLTAGQTRVVRISALKMDRRYDDGGGCWSA